MLRNSAQKITYDGMVILVEGKDDYLLIKNLDSNIKPNVINMDGYCNLEKKLEDIVKSTKQFKDSITHLLIIVDADDNFEQRKKEVLGKLRAVCIPLSSSYKLGTIEEINNINVGIYILPDNDSTGCLETLLLQSVKHSHILEGADYMIQCRKENETKFICNTQNKKDKIKYRLYMNALVVDQNFNYDKTFDKEIDYSHNCFNSLKHFINC